METKSVKLEALKLSQPIGDFFIAKIKADTLVEISYPDVRKLEKEREVESYLGIQRKLDHKRAKDIREYVSNFDATFPSSIILCINQEHVNWKDGYLTLEYEAGDDIAKILDGQHRIGGFMDLKTGEPLEDRCYFERDGKQNPFELLVTLFVGLDLSEQANIFATVNLKQTKVSKSLVYDLETYSKARSPQKSCHDIVVALSQHEKSPFYGRVKRLGYKEGKYQTLTQATLVEELIGLISKDSLKDRDILLRQHKSSFSSLRGDHLERFPVGDKKPFRDYFIDDEDEVILEIVFSFFSAVEGVWPRAWCRENRDSSLNKTVGVKALFRVLKEAMFNFYDKGITNEKPSAKYFRNLLESSALRDEYFSELDATSATATKLYNSIVERW